MVICADRLSTEKELLNFCFRGDLLSDVNPFFEKTIAVKKGRTKLSPVRDLNKKIIKGGLTNQICVVRNVLRLKCVDHSQKFLCDMSHGYAVRLAFGSLLGIVISKGWLVFYER